MASSRKPSAEDARLVMHLFELRREAEMRKARNFINYQFWPKSVEDVTRVGRALGTEQNAWLRMVFSYWEMAASLVVREVVHPGLFLDWNGEMWFVYAKLKPLLEQYRAATENPHFMTAVERVAEATAESRERLKRAEKAIARITSAATAAGKGR